MNRKSYMKIMIATDGSEHAKRSVSSGIEIAKLSGAKLYAVHVVPTVSTSSMPIGSRMPRWDEAYEVLKDVGNKAIDDVKEAVKGEDVEVEGVLLEGHPGDKLIEFAENNEIDMIVMGTLGKTGFEKFLLGSVADNVIRHSKVEVLVGR
ncbi:MAG: universal stress protein [Candidatus Heimdallarchaeota archaeon]|nr:universal stress protein [Candidatus Heimdallarchaeota archaeon]